MKLFTSKTQKIGEFGENICVAFLKQRSFTILERNYTKNIGEIDIIASKNNVLHFIEVKSIRGSKIKNKTYNPAQNLGKNKYLKIYKTMKVYLKEKNVSYETESQIDLYSIYIDYKNNNHQVEIVENIVYS